MFLECVPCDFEFTTNNDVTKADKREQTKLGKGGCSHCECTSFSGVGTLCGNEWPGGNCGHTWVAHYDTKSHAAGP
jgi:hypothetical protein